MTHIDADGFVSFDTIGGWDPQVFVGQRVRFLGRGGPVTGVVGKKAIHIMDKDDRERVSKVESLWIDIGAADRAEAERQLRIGDPGVLATAVLEFPNGRLVSRSIDNRIGLFGCWKRCDSSRGHGKAATSATAVATTREEIAATGGGARSSAASLEPDVAVVVDVTHATDYPGVDKRRHGDYRLGGGPVLSRGASVSEVVFELLAAAAEAEGIPYTIEPPLAIPAPTRRRSITRTEAWPQRWCRFQTATCTAPMRWSRWRTLTDRSAACRLRPPTEPQYRFRAPLAALSFGMIRPTFTSRLAALFLLAAPAGLQAQFGTQQQPVVKPAPPPITAIDDIRYLSDYQLQGRMTGSPGADTAAAYLARRFEQVGLQPAAGGWFQSFTVAKEAPVAQSARVGGSGGAERDRPAAGSRSETCATRPSSSVPTTITWASAGSATCNPRQHRQGAQRGG